MTKEEFYKIAQMRPEMPEKSVYRLSMYMRDPDDTYTRNEMDEWRLPLQTSPDAIYSSREEAEGALAECHKVISNVLVLHSAIIERIPLDKEPGAEPIAWWLYDANGNQVDRSVCSAYHIEDKKTPAGKYLGRYPEEIRFKKGDIVEVIGFDREKNEYVATLAIINSAPGTIEDEWRYFNRRQERDGEYLFDGLYHDLGYFHDFTDDQYGYLTGCGGDNTLTINIVAPSLPIPDEIRAELEQYQRNHAEWLKCAKKYDLTEAESRMLLRGEITEETIGTLRRMTEYLRQHPAKEIKVKKKDGKTEC